MDLRGRSEPGSPVTEEGGQGKENEMAVDDSPIFKRPSSLCVRTPVWPDEEKQLSK